MQLRLSTVVALWLVGACASLAQAQAGAGTPSELGPQAEPGPPEESTTSTQAEFVDAAASSTASSDVDDADNKAVQQHGVPEFDVRARLMAGAQRRRTHPGDGQQAANTRQPFFLKQARIKLSARLNKWLRLAFSADLEAQPTVRNAFANVRLKRYLQFRAGRFKRPMSRLELSGIGSLPFIERGLFNHALIERGGWGDRALGAMVHGKFKGAKLRYYAAVMNAAPSVDVSRAAQLGGADVLWRVEWKPLSALSLGVNGGHKIAQGRIGGRKLHLNAIGADARIRIGELRWVVESIAAQNVAPPVPPVAVDRTPWAISAISYAQYDVDLADDLVLQPVIFGEWLDTDLDYTDDEAVRGLLGINLLWRKDLRLMPYVELVRPLGSVSSRSFLSSETYAVALSLQI